MGNDRYLQIDIEGYLHQNGQRWEDPEVGRPILQNLQVKNRTYCSHLKEQPIFIQAFDAPLVAQSAALDPTGALRITFPYGHSLSVDPTHLSLDEWDRIHSITSNNIPIVFSRKAQVQLFDLAEAFSDDSITLCGVERKTPPYLPQHNEVGAPGFWNAKYDDWQQNNISPPWDLGGPTPFLKEVLPQLKILKQRVAVLGCGSAQDAHYLSELGHLVTAFDFSPSALCKAQDMFPSNDKLRYVEMDLLNPNPEFLGQFDLVLEHTFYCAINPIDRPKAINTYRKLLDEGGHLLADFFLITTDQGPPFGATEWELQKRMDPFFKTLYWTRWPSSPEPRKNWELIYYGQKRS